MIAEPEVASLGVIDGAITEHRPSSVFAMFSGGHDSLCSTHITAQHPSFTAAVHINTGIGIRQTREYVRETCRQFGWPLIELKTDPEVYRQQVLRYGFPAGRQQHQILFRILKERQVGRLIREHKTHRLDRIALVAGARRQESVVRMSTAQPVKRIKSQLWINPIVDWSHADKHDYMDRHQLPRNPVVDHLHMSGECLCGSFANMPESGELEMIRAFYPDAAAEIGALEHEVFKAGEWPNWGRFRPGGWEPLTEDNSFLPLCTSCVTRWEQVAA